MIIQYRLMLNSGGNIYIYADEFAHESDVEPVHVNLVYFDNCYNEYLGKRVAQALSYFIKFKEGKHYDQN